MSRRVNTTPRVNTAPQLGNLACVPILLCTVESVDSSESIRLAEVFGWQSEPKGALVLLHALHDQIDQGFIFIGMAPADAWCSIMDQCRSGHKNRTRSSNPRKPEPETEKPESRSQNNIFGWHMRKPELISGISGFNPRYPKYPNRLATRGLATSTSFPRGGPAQYQASNPQGRNPSKHQAVKH
jgi:hypothetical protein